MKVKLPKKYIIKEPVELNIHGVATLYRPPSSRWRDARSFLRSAWSKDLRKWLYECGGASEFEECKNMKVGAIRFKYTRGTVTLVYHPEEKSDHIHIVDECKEEIRSRVELIVNEFIEKCLSKGLANEA